jgi:hypothetical protein
MRVNADGLGYREIDRLSNLMHAVADRGVAGDTVLWFGYDLREDVAYCITAAGLRITSDNLTEYGFIDYN